MAASKYMLLAVAFAGLWCQALGNKSTSRKRSQIVEMIMEHSQGLTYPDGPAGNESAPVVVTIGFSIISINNVDESRGVLELTAYLYVSWNDSRVSASFPLFHFIRDVSHVVVPAYVVWTPDIELYDAAAPGMKFLNRKDQVVAHRSGLMVWAPQVSLSIPCVIDPSSPFNCHLIFGSWVYNGDQMDLAVRNEEADMSSFRPTNPRWTLNGTPRLRRTVKQFPCCPEPYPDVMVTIPLRRKEI